jgi:hypothetical protein
VDFRKGKFYVVSEARMRYGRFANGWVAVADEGVADETLGDLVRQALAESKFVSTMPNLREPDSPTSAMLAAAGVKSYHGYAKSAREVAVSLNDSISGFLMVPTRNGGPREGWVQLEDLAIHLDADASDEQIGANVRNAMRSAIGQPPSAWRGKA